MFGRQYCRSDPNLMLTEFYFRQRSGCDGYFLWDTVKNKIRTAEILSALSLRCRLRWGLMSYQMRRGKRKRRQEVYVFCLPIEQKLMSVSGYCYLDQTDLLDLSCLSVYLFLAPFVFHSVLSLPFFIYPFISPFLSYFKSSVCSVQVL